MDDVKNLVLKNNLSVILISTLFFDIVVGWYFKYYEHYDSTLFKIKYWTYVSILYFSFMILYIYKLYTEKLDRLNYDKGEKERKRSLTKKIISLYFLAYFIIYILIISWNPINIISGTKEVGYTNFIKLSLFIILFFIPLILMLLDTFRFIPVDYSLIYMKNFFKNLFKYSTEQKNSESKNHESYGDEIYFLNQKDEGDFIIERLGRFNSYLEWLSRIFKKFIERMDRIYKFLKQVDGIDEFLEKIVRIFKLLEQVGRSNRLRNQLSMMYSKLFQIRLDPVLTVILAVIITFSFWDYTFGKDEILRSSTWWGIFGIYLVVLLTYYRKSYNKVSSELTKSVSIYLEYNKIFDKFIRISAYIFWYSYFVYFIFSVSQFKMYNKVNFFEAFMLSVSKGELSIFLTFLTYFLSWFFIALPMIGDGFGIVPIICNLSKEIRLKIKNKMNLYHPDKSAGFKPLGNFCFYISLFIALPFIIGMPIQLLKYSISSDKKGILNYILDNPFNMAFIGVGLAGATIFIFSAYYINRLIMERKKVTVNKLMEVYKQELKDCDSTEISPKIACIDSALKKLDSIEIPPYGKKKVISFYSILFVPTVLIRLYGLIKDFF